MNKNSITNTVYKTFHNVDIFKSILNENIVDINNVPTPTSGLKYNDNLVVFISLIIICILLYLYFIIYVLNVFVELKSFSTATKKFFLPFIGFILICMANYKIWNYKNSSLYPDVKKIFSRDLPLPVIIYFMLCMTQTIISYMIALKDNNYDNWANFYIKYFITILFTYCLFLLVRNGYTPMVWIIAFLPLVLLYFLITYILVVTLINPNFNAFFSEIKSNSKKF